LYDLILSSDIVIACPYSSPIYIGMDAGKEAFWYDPTSTLEWKLGVSELPLIQGRAHLAARIRKALV
jgi:polysaccharide biosynthesis PFTS motif protein